MCIRDRSSGGATSAARGMDRLAIMANAAPEVVIMPGGGVSAQNAALFAEALPLQEIHASCSVATPAPALAQVADFGFQPPGQRMTDPARIRALRDTLDQIAASRPSG